ncbi:MAG: glycosyltransferase [Lachnospiraceae bacterium]|nr:glycosyltransferase [Lachnospiraceae bacterium]
MKGKETMVKVSIIMGIYNCAKTLPEAIDSILNQTFLDWELILCDDGSVDDTFLVAEQYRNQYSGKIKLLRNQENCGLNYTLNRCLKVAQGEYIARMDGDDISLPTRLEKEVRFLDSYSEYAIVSTDMQYFDEKEVWGRISHPEYPVKSDLVHESPFCHAPCLVRREAYEAVNGYTVDEHLLRVEDYHLWVKMYAAGFKGKNIHEPLYQMRDDKNAYNRRKFKFRLNEAYVKLLAVKELKLPVWMAIYSLRPIITGLMPRFLYNLLHKKRLARMN